MPGMYSRYAESKAWRTELLSYPSGGDFIERTARMSGNSGFEKLKHEAGVHRVQWVPQSDGQGRVATAKITVAVAGQLD
jgi:peptide chain release factor 1